MVNRHLASGKKEEEKSRLKRNSLSNERQKLSRSSSLVEDNYISSSAPTTPATKGHHEASPIFVFGSENTAGTTNKLASPSRLNVEHKFLLQQSQNQKTQPSQKKSINENGIGFLSNDIQAVGRGRGRRGQEMPCSTSMSPTQKKGFAELLEMQNKLKANISHESGSLWDGNDDHDTSGNGSEKSHHGSHSRLSAEHGGAGSGFSANAQTDNEDAQQELLDDNGARRQELWRSAAHLEEKRQKELQSKSSNSSLQQGHRTSSRAGSHHSNGSTDLKLHCETPEPEFNVWKTKQSSPFNNGKRLEDFETESCISGASGNGHPPAHQFGLSLEDSNESRASPAVASFAGNENNNNANVDSSHGSFDGFESCNSDTKSEDVAAIPLPVLPKSLAIAQEVCIVTQYFRLAKAGNFNCHLKGSLVRTIGLKRELEFPIGIHVDNSSGNIWICSTGKQEVKEFSWEGQLLRTLGKSNGGGFKRPSAICMDEEKNLLIKDDEHIQVFDKDLRFKTSFGKEVLSGPYGLRWTQDGNLVTLNQDKYSTQIVVFSQMGNLISTRPFYPQAHPSRGSKIRFFNLTRGQLIVSDLGLNQLYLTDSSGATLADIGGFGTGPEQFHQPSGIATDRDGNCIVGDAKNNRFQVYSWNLEYGGIISLDSRVRRPSEVFLTDDNHLLAVSLLEHCVKVFHLEIAV